MADNGVESHQPISDVKATDVVLKCYSLFSNKKFKKNPITNRLTKTDGCNWGQNDLDKEFVEQEDEAIQDKDEGEGPEIKL